MKRHFVILGVLALSSEAGLTLAQPYPSKPLRVIVTQTPGSSMDVLTRMLAPKMSELLGQQFVIDNRGGAAGLIGVQIGARAAPDGYTLVFGGASSMVNTTFTYQNPGFDSVKDFEPISLVVAQEAMLVVPPGLPVKSVKDLIALARAQPRKLNMACWNGFFAPRGMPAPFIKTVHEAIQKTLADPGVKESYAAQGMVPQGSPSPAAFGKFFREDFARVAKLIRIAGIRPE